MTGALSVLNVGFRVGSDLTVYDYCKKHGISFDVLEAWEPNCKQLLDRKICPIIHADIRRFCIPKAWDLVIWAHGPEHITLSEFASCRKQIESIGRMGTIYQTPIGDYPQDAIYCNPYEKHVTAFTSQIFNDMGYATFVHDKDGESTVSALSINWEEIQLVLSDFTICRRA
jgi:hypothetical protein